MSAHNKSSAKRTKAAGTKRPKFPNIGILERFKSVWWRGGLGRRIAIVVVAIIIFCTAGMYGMAQWYIARHSDEPLNIGVTFIPRYARSFHLDPRETMQAIIDDLGVKRFRLVSYWDEFEKEPGVYDFTDLDWQFEKANNAGAKVSLALGLRQPRWPECHMPAWAQLLPKDDWQPMLLDYIERVVLRYKDHPALHSYQLENEFFLKAFGICPDHSRDRLVEEFNLVRRLDPNTKLVVSMSNNAIGTPIGKPTPDQWAISVYKRVWDGTITRRYFEYPFPAWYYAFRAGWVEITRGRDSFIHELQAEAWTPPGYDIQTAPVDELYKSMNPERLRHRFEYGRATGMRTIDLWGVEWWYAMKINRNEPGLWQAAKDEFKIIN